VKVLVVTNLLRSTFPHELELDVYLVDGSRSKAAYLKAMLELPAVVRAGKYDVVHAHYGLTLVALLFVRSPIVVTFHGSDLLKQPVRMLSKLLARKAVAVIVVSENLRKALGFGTIIPCGINMGHFLLPAAWQARPNDELRVLFPGNPSVVVKNYPLFSNACQALANLGFKIREVHLVGVPREAVPRIFWESDVMLLTSYSEGSPMVIKEAIAAKLPFVTVNVGDISCRFARSGCTSPVGS
jgi:glycosyltransferase involved in cell wall biosynthesis